VLETLASSKEVIIHSYNLYLIQNTVFHLSSAAIQILWNAAMTFNLMYH